MAYSVEKTLPVVWLDENSFYYSAIARIQTSDLPHHNHGYIVQESTHEATEVVHQRKWNFLD